jgi:hypothetical protein
MTCYLITYALGNARNQIISYQIITLFHKAACYLMS